MHIQESSITNSNNHGQQFRHGSSRDAQQNHQHVLASTPGGHPPRPNEQQDDFGQRHQFTNNSNGNQTHLGEQRQTPVAAFSPNNGPDTGPSQLVHFGGARAANNVRYQTPQFLLNDDDDDDEMGQPQSRRTPHNFGKSSRPLHIRRVGDGSADQEPSLSPMSQAADTGEGSSVNRSMHSAVDLQNSITGIREPLERTKHDGTQLEQMVSALPQSKKLIVLDSEMTGNNRAVVTLQNKDKKLQLMVKLEETSDFLAGCCCNCLSSKSLVQVTLISSSAVDQSKKLFPSALADMTGLQMDPTRLITQEASTSLFSPLNEKGIFQGKDLLRLGNGTFIRLTGCRTLLNDPLSRNTFDYPAYLDHIKQSGQQPQVVLSFHSESLTEKKALISEISKKLVPYGGEFIGDKSGSVTFKVDLFQIPKLVNEVLVRPQPVLQGEQFAYQLKAEKEPENAKNPLQGSTANGKNAVDRSREGNTGKRVATNVSDHSEVELHAVDSRCIENNELAQRLLVDRDFFSPVQDFIGYSLGLVDVVKANVGDSLDPHNSLVKSISRGDDIGKYRFLKKFLIVLKEVHKKGLLIDGSLVRNSSPQSLHTNLFTIQVEESGKYKVLFSQFDHLIESNNPQFRKKEMRSIIRFVESQLGLAQGKLLNEVLNQVQKEDSVTLDQILEQINTKIEDLKQEAAEEKAKNTNCFVRCFQSMMDCCSSNAVDEE